MSLHLGNKRIRQVGVLFIQGDTSQFSESNIRSGVSMFGKTGTFTSSSTLGGGESPAAAENIMKNYSAWVNGTKVEGSLEVNNFYTGTSEPTSSLGKNGDIYLKK